MENLKVVLLKNGNLEDYLIGKVQELDEEPSLFIEDAFRIVNDQLEVYPKYSAQRDLFLTSDVDPCLVSFNRFNLNDCVHKLVCLVHIHCSLSITKQQLKSWKLNTCNTSSNDP